MPKRFLIIILYISGNVVNGTIGKQMVDTLVESSANVEVGKSLMNRSLTLFIDNLHKVKQALMKFFLLSR
jgi:hypothetical protein